jgi:hypothetical protein
VSEWKAILTSFGFINTYLAEIEPGDPTRDMMLCFLKPGELKKVPTTNTTSTPSAVEPPVAEIVRTLLGQVPKASFGFLESIIEKFNVGGLRDALVAFAKSRGWGTEWIESGLNMLTEGSKIARGMLDKAEVKERYGEL